MPAPPKAIFVMRHAEKPADALDPDLSAKGLARAERLAKYFPDKLVAPDFIFASAISKHSARPYETVRPLAKRVGKPIDATIADQDYGVLAYELLSGAYAGKRGVVCWHHGNIPSILHALGAKDGDYPDPWDRKVFDLILKVKLGNGAPKIVQIKEPF